MLQWIESGVYILHKSRLTQTSIFYSTSTCTYNWKRLDTITKNKITKKWNTKKKITKKTEHEEKTKLKKFI